MTSHQFLIEGKEGGREKEEGGREEGGRRGEGRAGKGMKGEGVWAKMFIIVNRLKSEARQ